MVARSEITQFFTQLLAPELFDDYCPNGLQIEGKNEIKRVAFAVSVTQESLRAAIDWKADALVAHHGLFWKYQGARPAIGAWGERLKLAIKHDLNVYGYHLPLDAHMGVGNAHAIATRLAMTDLAPFALHKRQPLGVQGRLTNPQTVAEFKQSLETLLNHSVQVATHDAKEKIETVGIITGGANNEWSEAHKAGLDAYITGEISEYNWHDAREAGLHFFAGGHHATEKFGPQDLMKELKAHFLDIEVCFFDSQNPA